MSANTRSKSQTPQGALEHVLSVIGKDPYAEIFVEAGIENIYDLLATDPSVLKDVSYLNDKGDLVTLKVAQRGKIAKLQSWYNHQSSKSIAVWYDLSVKILNDFIVNGVPTSIDPKPSGSSNVSASSGRTVLYGVKRNMSDYPKLRDDKLWLSFNRNFEAIAATHAVDEVLDPTFVPSVEQKDDFKAKNTFLYSVLSQPLLTAKSRVPVRAHENETDGQAVYRDLVQTYAEGTMASLNAEQLETSLKNFKADKSWNKPLATFLSTWSLKLADLETVRDKTYSDPDKRDLLIKAVTPHDSLYTGVTTAKTVEATVTAMTGEDTIDFDCFYNIILDHALTLDSTNKTLWPRTGNPPR